MFFNIIGGCIINTNIIDFLPQCKNILLYIDGNKKSYSKQDSQYNIIMQSFLDACKDGHEMPALGVALDQETKSNMTSGVFLEFVYDKQLTHNDMPFETLLVQINADDCGLNLIRKTNNQYQGRCFYYMLKQNLKNVYATLIKL